MRLVRFVVAWFLLAACFASAQDPSEVKVQAPTRLDWAFACRGFGPKAAVLPDDYDSRKQRYLLFAPAGTDGKTPLPLILFISPGDGPTGWNQWRDVCRKHGILFASPYSAGNKVPAGRRTRVILDVLDDVRRRHPVEPDRTYLAGFSGGGRMACAIAYSLPELFGGVIPVCGTNPIVEPTYLRHRIVDRLSVALVTGEKDFNRKENEAYMEPWLKELGVRTRLWVVPKVGHAIPGEATNAAVFAWLEEDRKRRRADGAAYPMLAWKLDAPSEAEQAAGFLAAARKDLADPRRVWRGVVLLQGAVRRWPNTTAGKKAAALLQEIVQDAERLRRVEEQGGRDERLSLAAQARALDRFGQQAVAERTWRLLAEAHPDTPEGKEARRRLDR